MAKCVKACIGAVMCLEADRLWMIELIVDELDTDEFRTGIWLLEYAGTEIGYLHRVLKLNATEL